MLKFSQTGIVAIEKIRQLMENAAAAFASLSDEENKACFDFHTEGYSLNHCVRWGLYAAENIHRNCA